MAGKFELKKAADGRFHFNLKAGNGEIILSSQMYKAKTSAQNGIASVQKNAPDDGRFERKVNNSGKDYFVLKAANSRVIGTSEAYSSKSSMENGIKSVKKNAPGARTVDLSA